MEKKNIQNGEEVVLQGVDDVQKFEANDNVPVYGPLYTPPVFPEAPRTASRSWKERIKQFLKGIWRSMQEIAVTFTTGMQAGEDWQRQNLLSGMDEMSKRLLETCKIELSRAERDGLLKLTKLLDEMRKEANADMNVIQSERYQRLYCRANTEKKKFQRKVLTRICKLPPAERYVMLKELFDLLYAPDILYNHVADKNAKALVWIEIQKTKKELQGQPLTNARTIDG